jgi:hypothetical protein
MNPVHRPARGLGRLLAAAAAAWLACGAAAQELPYRSQAKSLGVVTCASDLCHGSISRWKDSNVLQNEYVTWSRVDKHATRAYPVLLGARSKRIAANLGLEEPPERAKLCLDCHAFAPPPALRGARFKVEDGVSCEACHGPAENWIERHVETGATHADNVAHGLYPLENPVAQARLCLSCHFGNRDKFVTHRMMGAGHPRMSFELDTFAATQPAHYAIDDDWRRRKGEWNTVRTWAIGQALAASEILDVLVDPKRSRDGLFPELVVFDCNACHHPMSQRRWTPALGTSPGHIRLNDANLVMLRAIVRQALPEADAERFGREVVDLRRAMSGDGGDALSTASALRGDIDALVPRLAAYRFATQDLRAMLASLSAGDVDAGYHDYADAEQATMAIASLADYLARHGGLADVRSVNTALDRVYDAVRSDEGYRPELFREALAGLHATVTR